MPTYGYQCTQCQHEFQVFQAMKDDPVKICPECGGAVKRLLYPVGIVFKGSGWYINDSRKPDTSETADKAAADKGSSDTSSDSKAADSKSSESKPAESSADKSSSSDSSSSSNGASSSSSSSESKTESKPSSATDSTKK